MRLATTETVQRADELYRARPDTASIVESIDLLSPLMAADNFEAAWRLSRAYFFLGQEEGSSSRSKEHHRQGIIAGRRAVSLAAGRVEGYFWLGVNLALLAGREYVIAALRHAISAKNALLEAVRINPAYHGAGPLRVLARLEHKLPRIFGGGRDRARDHYQQAVDLAPSNTVTRIYFVELLLDLGKTTEARAHLNAVVNTNIDDPDWTFETERDRAIARNMLGRLGLE
jgi:tetratricopeptide (TPR) repeat protein